MIFINNSSKKMMFNNIILRNYFNPKQNIERKKHFFKFNLEIYIL